METLRLFFKKVLENFISVKVWFFLLPFIGSTGIFIYICESQFALMAEAMKLISTDPAIVATILDQIKVITDTFIAWCTFNVTLTGSIMAVREVIKVRKLKEINESENEDKRKAIENVNT